MAAAPAAMHMSDGLVDAPTSLLFAGIATVGVVVAAWRARSELDERTAPMAGLVAAFIFALQMVNFPILPGVSGHLLGGALAAILAGPYVGALCVAIVLVVQSLLFADGGLTALGTNITNMALIGVAAGYVLARLLAPMLVPRGQAGIAVTGFLAALVGTLAAAMGFVLEYTIGGASGSSLGEVTGYMLITHLLIGIGEGVITAITVTAVARARPDLVYLLRAVRRPESSAAVTAARRERSMTAFLLAFAGSALLVAGLLSHVASSQPDGLDATTQRGCTVTEVDGTDELTGACIAQHARDHGLADSVLADYTVAGNDKLTGAAGIIGVLAVFAALLAVIRLVRVGRNRPTSPAPDAAARSRTP